MRRIILLFMAIAVVLVANAQQPIASESVAKRIEDIDRQVKNLTEDIDDAYNSYINSEYYEKIFSEDKKKKTPDSFSELNNLKAREKDTILGLDYKIDSVNNEMNWLSSLRDYYEKTDLDELFPRVDTMMLKVHYKLVPSCMPILYLKGMKDGMGLLVKANTTPADIKAMRSVLSSFTDCNVKWEVDGLLAAYETITQEVDEWVGKGENVGHTLREYMEFRQTLMNEYHINLDTDYPRLSEKARNTVKMAGK